MIELIVLTGLAIVCFDFLFVVRSSAFLGEKQEESLSENPRQALVMILAVYEETETIEEAIKFLESNDLQGITQIIIVGNARERNGDGINPTLKLANKVVTRPDFIKILECNIAGAIKAHQVNFAASQIDTETDHTWLYVMDVDTRFTQQNVKLLRTAMLQEHAIIQQHTHFLEGYDNNSIVGKSFAAHQTRWTLAHEMTRIWLYNKFRVGVYHLVGHGMCIKCSTFKELGGFSETVKIEDIHFGYMCCMKGYKVRSIGLLEGSDTPAELKSLWQQQYGWSLGAFQIQLYWRLLLDTGFQPSPYNRIQNAFCVWNYIRWLGQSIFMWFMLFLLLFGVQAYLVSIFFAIYILSFWISGLAMKRKEVLNDALLVAFVALGFLNSFIRSFPVINCFFDQLRGVERKKYKTRHRKL
ncbi:glycosyltransferase family 2 protein [Roseovarius pelagicus]|uniref:Glycosyltransferase family 2 protein n=1 Tax=Roseovarius pelagicus TaxID=2980108 RepID=A0ABY6D6L2_9RHOB|nr:glycosyltransferase family 2 protein [Roseovarius pelagicus]UXX81781.1 glycosyltransferase family 2 protein [Roseovarius pelagicus]